MSFSYEIHGVQQQPAGEAWHRPHACRRRTCRGKHCAILGASAHVTAPITVNHHGSGPQPAPATTYLESFFSLLAPTFGLNRGYCCDTDQTIWPHISWAAQRPPRKILACCQHSFGLVFRTMTVQGFSMPPHPSPSRSLLCLGSICLAPSCQETCPIYPLTTTRPKTSKRSGRHPQGSRPE